MIDEQTLNQWACELGFAQAALCSLRSFDRERQIVSHQATLRERQQLKFDPEKENPQAKSIAVLLWPYSPTHTPQGENVFIDSYYYASNAAFHAAKLLEKRLLDSGCFAKANVSYPAKEAAVRAGLGIIGKHSLLITEKYGTRVVIILIAVDIESESSDIQRQVSSCLNCGRCSAACPGGAIDEYGMNHPERCLRNFMMEGVIIPEELRDKMGSRLIGCDLCQHVCPMQRQTDQPTTDSFQLSDFVTNDPVIFSNSVSRLAEQIGRNAARPQRVRAQAAILAGNSKNPAYLPVLRTWAQSPFDAVREHAKWAIEKIERSNSDA